MQFKRHRKGRGQKAAEYIGTRGNEETGGLNEI